MLRYICDIILTERKAHIEQFGKSKQNKFTKHVIKIISTIDSKFHIDQDGLFLMLTNLSRDVNLEILETVIQMFEDLYHGKKNLEEAGSVVNDQLNKKYIESKIQ